MKPVLGGFEIAGRQISIPAYGVMVMLAFVVAIAMAVHRGRRRGFSSDAMLDLCWWLLITSLVGARLFYVLQHAGDFAALCLGVGEGQARAPSGGFTDCVAPLRIWQGGLVFYGGILAAGGFAYWFARRRRWSFAVLADATAPAIAIGHAIGRLGCFLAGCCYGHVCAEGGALCVRFPVGSAAHDHFSTGAANTVLNDPTLSPPVMATQLIEAAALLGLSVGMLLWEKRQKVAGQLFLIYVGTYAVLRFFLELYRGDDAQRFLVSLVMPAIARLLRLPPDAPLLLSTSQAVSLALLLGALLGAWRLRTRFFRSALVPKEANS